MGRGFVPDDVGQPVVIVSSAFWRGKLDGDPRAIGREIVLGGQTHTIVGVLPERFFFALDVSDIWRPLPMTAAQAAHTVSAGTSDRPSRSRRLSRITRDRTGRDQPHVNATGARRRDGDRHSSGRRIGASARHSWPEPRLSRS